MSVILENQFLANDSRVIITPHNAFNSYAQAANNAKLFTSDGVPNSYSDNPAHRARITDVELEFMLSSCRFKDT